MYSTIISEGLYMAHRDSTLTVPDTREIFNVWKISRKYEEMTLLKFIHYYKWL